METKIIAEKKEKVKIKKPKQYKVVMHNDDFTTMEFVVNILMTIFKKDINTSNKIMMDVHKLGRGIVGVYPYDIATIRPIIIAPKDDVKVNRPTNNGNNNGTSANSVTNNTTCVFSTGALAIYEAT